MHLLDGVFTSHASPSSRRAWIEIPEELADVIAGMVALLAEGVDRNKDGLMLIAVDDTSPSSRRAWIEIG